MDILRANKVFIPGAYFEMNLCLRTWAFVYVTWIIFFVKRFEHSYMYDLFVSSLNINMDSFFWKKTRKINIYTLIRIKLQLKGVRPTKEQFLNSYLRAYIVITEFKPKTIFRNRWISISEKLTRNFRYSFRM